MTLTDEEIKYNIINSLLAGALTLLGAFTTAETITFRAVLAAIAAAGIVAITKFKVFWEENGKTKGKKGQIGLFTFV